VIVISKSIKERIELNYEKLSIGQKKIAKDILDNQDHYMYYSISSMSKELDISMASLSRFVKKLDYKNYAEFKQALSDEVLLHLNPNIKMESTLNRLDESNGSIEGQIIKDIDTMSMFIQKMNDKEINRAIAVLSKTKNIVLMGLGISKSLIYFLDFRLKRMGVQTKVMVSGGAEFIEELTTIRKNDLIITVSFKREYKELLLALNYANKFRIPTISITENTKGKIAKTADIVLEVNRGPYEDLNSLALPISFCNALLLKVAHLQKESIHSHMDVLTDINNKYFEQEEN